MRVEEVEKLKKEYWDAQKRYYDAKEEQRVTEYKATKVGKYFISYSMIAYEIVFIEDEDNYVHITDSAIDKWIEFKKGTFDFHPGNWSELKDKTLYWKLIADMKIRITKHLQEN